MYQIKLIYLKQNLSLKKIKNKLNTNLNNYNNNNYKYFNNNKFSNYINKYSNNYNIHKKLNNNFNFSVNDDIFYSIQINSSIPTDIREYGSYLISHIEKEENYKTLFLREIKSFKRKKKNYFKFRSKRLLFNRLLLDLWEKWKLVIKQDIKF